MTASEYGYNDFIPLPVEQPPGFIVSFSVHITGARDAYILLAPGPNSDGVVYEIRKFENFKLNLRHNLQMSVSLCSYWGTR